ncbi:unnamed protein product [Sphagnum troendelagicum]|uniref:RING-type E3 ubiquitin transferase n=1 Tax=Sphagnum troendelagicum TaxID=128251 RepID=A0ABP0U7W5_9BRYO
MEGPWTVLQGFSEDLNGSIVDSTRMAEPQLFGSSSNHTGRMDDCLPEASGNQELLNTTGACSSEGHHHTSARSSELPIVASGLEETVTHRAASLRETLDLMPETHRGSRLGKSRTISSESLVDANEESSSSSLLVPDETPGSSSTFCHSGSPSRLTGRSGMPSSPRHRDNGVGLFSLGEQLSHRYMGSSTHSFTSSLSSASQLGATVGTDSRLHNHAINFSNLEAMSPGAPVLADSVPPTMQTSSTRVSSPSPSRPPHPSRGRIQGNSVPTLLTNPAMSGPAPSRLSPSPPSSPSLVAPFADSHSSPTIHFQRSLLPRASASRFHERGFSLAADGLLGMPSHSLQVSAGDGTHPPRLMTEGLAEVKCVERDEDLTYEQLLMLEATLLFEGMGLHDHHRELRLDVDNMSYEELLALEDRIGNVSTGLTAEAVADKLKMSYYSSLNMAVARFSQEYDIKCSICQEEYEDGDELGKVDCGHSYHVLCIQQWLVQKNQCPICKAPAFA